jgi:hypothetical protein
MFPTKTNNSIRLIHRIPKKEKSCGPAGGCVTPNLAMVATASDVAMPGASILHIVRVRYREEIAALSDQR